MPKTFYWNIHPYDKHSLIDEKYAIFEKRNSPVPTPYIKAYPDDGPYIDIGTLHSIIHQCIDTIKNRPDLQKWIKKERHLLVITIVDDEGNVTHTFHANTRNGEKLLFPYEGKREI